jgi:2-oxoisovalerate dehydrogenase E1 component
MSGDVGSQYTPAAGWAQSIQYRAKTLKEAEYEGACSVVLGGDASVATNGFWSALTMATTLKLPLLFYIEDNGYGISVPSQFQTPGQNIAENLASFKNLFILDGNGSDPVESATLLQQGLSHVRSWKGPALVRLRVPRLSGHSGQDTQTYKDPTFIADEQKRDPLPKLRALLVPAVLSEDEWKKIELQATKDIETALAGALARPDPDPAGIHRHRFAESSSYGGEEIQLRGGVAAEGHTFPASSTSPTPEGSRINVVTAVRKTLESELRTNPKLVVFGEDVGPKGGVHAATLGLQEAFGADRVFDTSLSEEGIIGRAVGMAIAGLMPVAEIQFRKYADPATEQLHNTGTMRWRTNNRFAAPMVVRMPGGFFKCGDPWHSVCDEVMFVHSVGWQLAFPSNAEDAVGLLRTALRSNNPTIFFEHRHLLDAAWARRPYPGDQFALPFGQGKVVQAGNKLTIISWGAMVEVAEEASKDFPGAVEIVDLRTLMPWDRTMVLTSVRKTHRALILHEDGMTAGFGAEVSATIAEHAVTSLDAPIARIAVADIPIPYNVTLLDAVVPNATRVTRKIKELLEY